MRSKFANAPERSNLANTSLTVTVRRVFSLGNQKVSVTSTSRRAAGNSRRGEPDASGIAVLSLIAPSQISPEMPAHST